MADEPRKSWAEVLYIDPRHESGRTAKTTTFPLGAAMRQVALDDFRRRWFFPIVLCVFCLAVFVWFYLSILYSLPVRWRVIVLAIGLIFPAACSWYIVGMRADVRRGVCYRSEGNIGWGFTDTGEGGWLSVGEIAFLSVPGAAVTAMQQSKVFYGTVDYLKRSREILAIRDGDGVLRYQIASYQGALTYDAMYPPNDPSAPPDHTA